MKYSFIRLLVLTNIFNGYGAFDPDATRRLLLDDQTMEATFGTSAYHSKSMKSNIGKLHDTGDEWSAVRLSEYCLTGIFQHYMHELSGLDMNFNYDCEVLAIIDVEKFTSLSKKVLGIGSKDTSFGQQIASILTSVADDLKGNSVFAGLGVCFHRNKVILEKREDDIHIIPETGKGLAVREIRFAEIMEIDRLAIDQQTAFFHWMKERVETAIGYMEKYYKQNGKLPANDDKALIELKNHVPQFMEWPIYKKLIPLALAEIPE